MQKQEILEELVKLGLITPRQMDRVNAAVLENLEDLWNVLTATTILTPEESAMFITRFKDVQDLEEQKKKAGRPVN